LAAVAPFGLSLTFSFSLRRFLQVFVRNAQTWAGHAKFGAFLLAGLGSTEPVFRRKTILVLRPFVRALAAAQPCDVGEASLFASPAPVTTAEGILTAWDAVFAVSDALLDIQSIHLAVAVEPLMQQLLVSSPSPAPLHSAWVYALLGVFLRHPHASVVTTVLVLALNAQPPLPCAELATRVVPALNHGFLFSLAGAHPLDVSTAWSRALSDTLALEPLICRAAQLAAVLAAGRALTCSAAQHALVGSLSRIDTGLLFSLTEATIEERATLTG
jgi:hypothetical protein